MTEQHMLDYIAMADLLDMTPNGVRHLNDVGALPVPDATLRGKPLWSVATGITFRAGYVVGKKARRAVAP
jgi:hypothetical protein